MSLRSHRVLALAVAIAAALAACSSPGAGGTEPGAGGASPGSAGKASAGGGTGGSGTSTPGAGGTGAGGTASPSSSQQANPPDFVYASPQDGNSWGCDFNSGEKCRIRFDGRYRLTTASRGSIEALIWEDGASTPATSARLPVPKPGGSLFYIELSYRVGKGVQTVVLGTRLLDGSGRVLHEGFRFTARVGRVWHKQNT